MIELQATTPEQILFIHDRAVEGESWSLLRIQTFDGNVVGLDSTGSPLAYPVSLTVSPGTRVWVSPPIRIDVAGKYLAVFGASTGAQVARPVGVLPAASQSGGNTGGNGGSSSSPDYVTKEALLERFGEAALVAMTNNGRASEINAGVLTSAMSRAGQEVNGYLAVQYQLPLASVPDLVRSLAEDCTMGLLAMVKAPPPENFIKAYDRAKAMLADIARRKLSLGIAPPPTHNASHAAVFTVGTRHFSRARMGGF